MSDKRPFYFLILAGFVLAIIFMPSKRNKEITYQEFQKLADNGLFVGAVTVDGGTVKGNYIITDEYEKKPGKTYQKFQLKVNRYTSTKVMSSLETLDIPFFVKQSSAGLSPLALALIPTFILIAAFFYLDHRQKQRMTSDKGDKVLKTDPTQIKVTFDDVVGMSEAKTEVTDIMDFLKDPGYFNRLGAKIPKGALMVGPPGTGKTLLAKAMAKEAGVPFFYKSGSQFIEMYVGVGAKRVRSLFEAAKEAAPCIIFIDEIDAIGGTRGSHGGSGGDTEREQTINELLTQMDGFHQSDGVIVLAATNRSDTLDPALKRRFSREIYIDVPSLSGREAILELYVKKMGIVLDNIDCLKLAKGTPGFSGAKLENLVNEAALIATKDKSEKINMHHFDLAKDKLLMGTENRNLVLSDLNKKKTAYHEAGHALINLELKMDELHKVSIIPRGGALGVTMTLPNEEDVTYSEVKCRNMMAMLMGGRVAEKLHFDEVGSGAQNDIERATDIAYNMVYLWGMSEMGPIHLKEEFSEKFKFNGEEEIKKLVLEAEDQAIKILTQNKDRLILLAEELFDNEVLDGDEVDKLMGVEIC
jgi:cell division protease FtsH